MAASDIFRAAINEDATTTLLGRLCARDGTGAASPTATEGNLAKQADISSIEAKVFDLSGTTPTTATQTYTLTVSSVIYDTLQTSGVWGLIDGGGNFLYDLPAAAVPSSDLIYRVEVSFTFTNGNAAKGKWELTTTTIQGS